MLGKADVFIVTCDLFTTGADHLQAGHIDVLMLLFFFVVLHHFARHGDFMVFAFRTAFGCSQ